MFRHLQVEALPLLAGALLASGCVVGATAPGTRLPSDEITEVRGTPDAMEELQPADIAIAPVRNQTGVEDVPVGSFREAFSTALIDRLYSPLGLDYVDGNWVESSFRGTPAPDALLVVALTEWNPTHLYSTGIVEIGAEFFLFEGGSTTGAQLWGLTVRRRIDMGDGRGNPPAPADHLIPRAIQRFAKEALIELPERDPIAAHASP